MRADRSRGLPSGIAVSGLSDHDRPAADGVRGGSRDQLDRPRPRDVSHLAEAVVQAERSFARGRSGLCGRLDVHRRGVMDRP
ncbi:hypothetical protein ABT382_18220 [Streptomyces pharetrae]|uniref:hypothetical protein n=1 Tax=Streptomyces pharetrae TaxID=291370 RepID=UPI00335D7BCB